MSDQHNDMDKDDIPDTPARRRREPSGDHLKIGGWKKSENEGVVFLGEEGAGRMGWDRTSGPDL